MSASLITENGSGTLLAKPLRPQADVGSDEHRVETARWVLETFEPGSQIYKKATRVLEAYLLGKPLPGA